MHRPRTSKRLRKVVLALASLGLVLGLQVAGVSPARAVTAHPAASGAQLHQALAATTPSGDGFWWGAPVSGGVWLDHQPCAAGNYSTDFALSDPAKGAWVTNDCNVRVWLHQYSNGTGYNLCISPSPSATVFIYRSYQNIYVSTNGANC